MAVAVGSGEVIPEDMRRAATISGSADHRNGTRPVGYLT
jgi:hypothetical protein